jgi:hypothetical protein
MKWFRYEGGWAFVHTNGKQAQIDDYGVPQSRHDRSRYLWRVLAGGQQINKGWTSTLSAAKPAAEHSLAQP